MFSNVLIGGRDAKANWRLDARKRWPKAIWINGDGPWACAAHCGTYAGYGSGTSVQLHRTQEEAEKSKRMIDGSGCGGQCKGIGGHEIVNFQERP